MYINQSRRGLVKGPLVGSAGAVLDHHLARLAGVHPIPITRFWYFGTQPLENLSAAVKPPIKKRFLGNPTLGKSLVRENIVMGTGSRTSGSGARIVPERRFEFSRVYSCIYTHIHTYTYIYIYMYMYIPRGP